MTLAFDFLVFGGMCVSLLIACAGALLSHCEKFSTTLSINDFKKTEKGYTATIIITSITKKWSWKKLKYITTVKTTEEPVNSKKGLCWNMSEQYNTPVTFYYSYEANDVLYRYWLANYCFKE